MSRLLPGVPAEGKWMPGLALVDYDNLSPPPKPGRDTPRPGVGRVVEAVVIGFRRAFRDLRDLDIRLYGGWIDERGRHTRAAAGLNAELPLLRSIIRGVSVRPVIATRILQVPDLVLRGTVRLRARPVRQKMVDGMLGCDALFAASSGMKRVGVVTDDEDLVPALLAAQVGSPTRGPVWMRRRATGTAPNDDLLTGRGVRIVRISEVDRA